jgi:uncharacterized cupin superfamily protein
MDDIAPKSLVVNAFQQLSQQLSHASGNQAGVDLATPFGLSRIKINYFQVSHRETWSSKDHANTNQFCYIIKGKGVLRMNGDGQDERKDLKKDDCFSFPSQVSERIYILETTNPLEELGVIVFADLDTSDRAVTVGASLILFSIEHWLITNYLTVRVSHLISNH